MKTRLTIAAIGMALTLSLAPSAHAEVAYASNFQFFEAEQKVDVWCWAACIQMMLNYKGVQWSQEDVVEAVKGYVSRETASDAEIYRFLNQWGFDYDGDYWASRCAFYRGAPRPDWLVQELLNDRPLIVSYMTGPTMGHVVVLHTVDYTPTPAGPIINSVVVFDPMSGQDFTVHPQVVLHHTKGHWFVDVRKLRS